MPMIDDTMHELNPIKELLIWVDLLGIKKEDLYNAYSSLITQDTGTAKRIINGKAEPYNLNYQQYLDILTLAVNNREKKQERERAKELKVNYDKNRDFIEKYFRIICSPCISSLGGPINEKEKDAALKKCKTSFYRLTPKSAYILSHNIQAFLSLLNPDILKFYNYIKGMKKEVKIALREKIKKLDMIVLEGEMVNQFNSLPLRQWKRIRNDNYKKTLNRELALTMSELNSFEKKYLSQMAMKNVNHKKLHGCIVEQPEAKEYLIDKSLLDKYWGKFLKQMKEMSFPSSAPLFIISQTYILNDITAIDLLIDFLSCTPQNQQRILMAFTKTDR